MNNKTQIRVLIAEGQSKVRSALRLALEQQPDTRILGEAVDARGVLDWAHATCPDVILLDWELPGRAAMDLGSGLHRRCPDLTIIALSARPEVARAAREAGVDAFVSKVDPPEALLSLLAQFRNQAG
jgi:two-component system invasion response regulator UvrY